MSPTSAVSPLPPTPGSPRVRRLSRSTAPPPGRIDIPKVLSASHFSALASNGPPTTGGGGFPSAPGSNYLSSRPPTPSYYREALADIHAILYAGAFGGGPSGREGFEEMADCVARWYETDAVFDNPIARSTGRDSIANQFLWMSSVPGERWSEVGDVCECQDFSAPASSERLFDADRLTADGNYILILSHTLHVSFFPAPDGSHRPPIPTPFQSVPPTPFAYTPAPGTPGTSIVSEHHLHHQHSYGHLAHSRNMSEQNLPPPVDGQHRAASQEDEDDEDDEEDGGNEEEDETDRGTSSAVYVARNPSHHRGAGAGGTPIGLALAALHPRHVLARLGHYHLRVITRLEFNEQGRVAYHEDHWGVKELVEGTLPLLGQLYYFQRQATGTLGNWLAKRFWARGAPTVELDDTRRALETPRTPGTATASAVSPWTTRTPATAVTGITTEGEAGSTTASSVDDGEGGALKQAAERVRRQQKGRGWTPSMGLWSGSVGSRVGQTRDVEGQVVDGVMDLEEGYQSPPPADLDGEDVTLRSLRRRRKAPPPGRKMSKGKGKAEEEVQADEAESKLSVAQGVYDE